MSVCYLCGEKAPAAEIMRQPYWFLKKVLKNNDYRASVRFVRHPPQGDHDSLSLCNFSKEKHDLH